MHQQSSDQHQNDDKNIIKTMSTTLKPLDLKTNFKIAGGNISGNSSFNFNSSDYGDNVTINDSKAFKKGPITLDQMASYKSGDGSKSLYNENNFSYDNNKNLEIQKSTPNGTILFIFFILLISVGSICAYFYYRKYKNGAVKPSTNLEAETSISSTVSSSNSKTKSSTTLPQSSSGSVGSSISTTATSNTESTTNNNDNKKRKKKHDKKSRKDSAMNCNLGYLDNFDKTASSLLEITELKDAKDWSVGRFDQN